MEGNGLNNALCRAERPLAAGFADTVDQHLRGALHSASHSGQIVAFGMPRDFADDIFQGKGHHLLEVDALRETPGALVL